MLCTSLYVLRFKRLACPVHSDTLNITLSNYVEDKEIFSLLKHESQVTVFRETSRETEKFVILAWEPSADMVTKC